MNILNRARTAIGKRLYNVPGFLEWRLNEDRDLAVWKPKMPGRPIEVYVHPWWLDRVNQDTGHGEITGMDSDGRREAAFVDAFMSKIDSSTVLLDVGASFGVYAVFAAQKCDPNNIYCFEPEPVARWILARNSAKHCGNRLHVDARQVAATTRKNKVSLDDFCEQKGIKPTFVKIDVEGAEVDLVKGMRRICTEHKPTILMEFHVRKIRRDWHRDPNEVIDTLQSYGYRLSYNGHHWHLVEHHGVRDSDWHDALPNEINCALLAEAQSKHNGRY